MKNIELQPLTLHLGIDENHLTIEEHNLENHAHMIGIIANVMGDYKAGHLKGIWLFTTSSELGEVIVTQNLEVVLDFLTHCKPFCYSKNDDGLHYHLFLQESFESCYSIASDMREGNPLCYDKD